MMPKRALGRFAVPLSLAAFPVSTSTRIATSKEARHVLEDQIRRGFVVAEALAEAITDDGDLILSGGIDDRRHEVRELDGVLLVVE